MDDRHIAEHFVVAGLPPPEEQELLEEFSCDGATLKSDHSLPPITEIGVVNMTLGEEAPDGYTVITHTPSGGSANLNLGVFRAPEMFLCYKRGRHQLPLVDIGVLYNGRERVLSDSQVVEFSVTGCNSGNINTSYTTYLTYRRATPDNECNELIVSDICIKNREPAPHSYCTIEKNVNKGNVVGAEVYICYRKSVNRFNYIAYKPALLDHYSPLSREPSFSLPSDFALFCVPMGATLESWPQNTRMPGPVFSTFVLTLSNPQTEAIDKVYCAGVTFYERYDHQKLSNDQKTQLKLNDHFGINNVVYSNKSICLLSLWPFFDTFEVFLTFLHKMSFTGPHKVPIERYIWHLLENVPFPSPRGPRILLQLDSQTKVSLTQPEDSPIALSGAKFRELLSILRPNGCIQLLIFAMTEQKILLHSLRSDVLTAAAEALSMIIFPFHWQCPYIPLCPLGLSSFLNAPIPFLLGLDSRFFDIYHPPQEVVCVDLDTGAIFIPDDKQNLNEKMLPRKPYKVLRATLDHLCNVIDDIECYRVKLKQRRNSTNQDSLMDSDFKIKKKEQEVEVLIQEAFLTFTASILHGYSSFLQPIVSKNSNPDTATLFDVDGFVKSRDRSYQKFFNMVVNTQMFSKFIEERSFVSDNDASLAFFDECMDRVSNSLTSGEPLGRLLEVEPSNGEHTSFLPPPEPPPNVDPDTTWTYEGFPKLDKSLLAAAATPPARLLPPTTTAHNPPSPMARRSKQEVRSAQRQAVKQAQRPLTWVKYLVSTSYSVWFTQLASLALTHQHKGRVLQLAYKVLVHMQQVAQHNTDEVSYRIMMQLCGVYSQPVLAVKVLCAMTAQGITPNAITYGYYNRAVLENKWSHSNLYWNKLRNVVSGVAAFRSCGRDRAERRQQQEGGRSGATKSVVSEDKTDSAGASAAVSTSVQCSTPRGSNINNIKVTANSSRATHSCSVDAPLVSPKSSSIEDVAAAGIERTPLHCVIASTTLPVVHSAGLVMTSPLDDVFEPSRRLRSRPTDLVQALTPTLKNYDLMSESSVPHPLPPDSTDPRNAGGDGKIFNRLWSLASSYMAYNELSPASTAENTPKHVPRRSSTSTNSAANRWERSVERWDNSPKASREWVIRNSAAQSVPDEQIGKKDHARSDSGSSTSSNTIDGNVTRVSCEKQSSGSSEVNNQTSTDTNVIESNVDEVLGVSTATTNCDTITTNDTKSLSEESLSDIAEEDSSNTGSALTRNFFTRNTSERLSSLIKRGVGGADQKIRGLWKKGVKRSDSKDSMGSLSSVSSTVSSQSTGKILSPPLSEVGSPIIETCISPSVPNSTGIVKNGSPPNTSLSKMLQSPTDLELFKMKGEQPRLFQTPTSEEYKTPPSFPTNASDNKCNIINPVTVPTTTGRSKVILGDPLGALDSPQHSPVSSFVDTPTFTPESEIKFQSSQVECSTESKEVKCSNETSVVCETIYNNLIESKPVPSKPRSNQRKYEELNFKPSTVRATQLTPLCVSLQDGTDASSNTSDESKAETSRSEPGSTKPSNVPWTVTPLGSPFSVPVAVPVIRSATLPRSADRNNAALPPLPPSTPNKRQSRSTSKARRGGARSSSISAAGEVSSEIEDSIMKGNRPGGLASNSLTSLSSLTDNHGSAAADLAPRQARTLDSSTSWSLRMLSEEGHQAALTNLASSGLQKLGSFRENYLDPTVAELLGNSGSGLRKTELLSGGLNSMKTAMTSFSKKLRQSISANNTPTKGTLYNWRSFDTSSVGGDEESVVDGLFSRRESSVVPDSNDELLLSQAFTSPSWLTLLGGGNSDSGSTTGQLFEAFNAGPGWEAQGPYCLGVSITSCSKCHNCQTLLYDEEIMAGWSADHSNLNTRCRYCERLTVPELTIMLYDMFHVAREEAPTGPGEAFRVLRGEGNHTRGSSGAGQTKENILKNIKSKTCSTEKLTIAYLSPLVLRKELDTMLSHEGDASLTLETCPEKHPILYWNMLWYFTRLGLPSQLPGLCLAAKLANISPDKIHSSWKKQSTGAGVPKQTSDVKLERDTNKTAEINGGSATANECLDRRDGQGGATNTALENDTLIRDEIKASSNEDEGQDSSASVPKISKDNNKKINEPWEKDSLAFVLGKTSATQPDWRNVFVICMWDNPLYHAEVGLPLYMQLRQRGQHSALVRGLVHQPLAINENVLQSILTCLHIDDMSNAMQLLLNELNKRPCRLQHHRLPLYRDLLLLAIEGLSSSSLNIVSFEQKYRAAYAKFEEFNMAGLLTPADSAPPFTANLARRYFPPLCL